MAISDTLPAGLSFGAQTTGASDLVCGAVGQLVTCTGTPNIAAGASVTLGYTTNVAPTASGKLINAVLVTATGGDPRIPANDALEPASGAATQSSNLLAAKSAQTVSYGTLAVSKALSGVSRGGSALGSLSGYVVQSGDILTYTVSVQETGNSGSATTTLSETAPVGTSYTGAVSEGWTLANGIYTQSVNVPAGQTVTKTFTVTVGALADGVTSINNTVSTSLGSCTNCTVITATAPRLAVSKVAPTIIATGGSASWSVTVTNNGGSATFGTVTLSDTLPAGLSYGAQTAGASDLVCGAVGQLVTCTGTPNIAAGASVTLSYTTNVAPTASGKLVNAVLVTATGGDPRIPANDAGDPASGASTQGSDKLSAKAARSVSGGTLAVSKALASVNGDPAVTLLKVGDIAVYSIAVRETGGEGAGQALLTETVPPNTRYTGNGEGWSSAGHAFTQTVTVPAGQTVTKTFTVTVGALDDSVTEIANTVTTSQGTCSHCTVSNKVVNLAQTRENRTLQNTAYTPDPIPGCAVSGLALLTAPKHGAVLFKPDSSVVYTPDGGYTGADSYRYSVNCGPSVEVVITATVMVIDPSGVIYDAVTRLPVRGATVVLIGPSGEEVPDTLLDLALGGRNRQVTGPDGRYALLLKTNAQSGTYQLRVLAPNGYKDAPAISIAPSAALYTPALGGGIEYIQKQETAPALIDPVPYYLAFAFRLGSSNPALLSNGVAHNHIPLDPTRSPLPLVVSKTASKRSAGVGDLVPYRITVRVQDGVARGLANVVDIVPAGMRYVAGSGVVNGIAAEPKVLGNTLTWERQVIPDRGTMVYDLVLRLGAGVMKGKRTNVAVVRGSNGLEISNRAEADITVGPDPLFDCTDVFGKVFDDRNANGKQDPDEEGLANIRLATVNGLLANTDLAGRFHIACAAMPNARIGSNFVLKLDPASLPSGYRVIGENPASARLTAGLMHEVDFAVGHIREGITLSNADFTDKNQMAQVAEKRILQKSKQTAGTGQPLHVRYAAIPGEDPVQIELRLDVVEATIRQSFKGIKDFDREIIWLQAGERP